MESAPPLDHEARFSRGSLWRGVHEAPVDRHDREDRARPIRQQDDCSEQPTPVEGAEIGNEPEEARPRSRGSPASCSPAGRPAPLGEEGAVVELKARGLLGDVDVDRRSREHGSDRERKRSSKHSHSSSTCWSRFRSGPASKASYPPRCRTAADPLLRPRDQNHLASELHVQIP